MTAVATPRGKADATVTAPGRGRRKLFTARRATPYLLLLPALTTFALFQGYPIVDSMWISFTTGNGSDTRSAGFSNYTRLIHDPLFWTSLKNTGEILVIQVPIMLVLAVLFALAMNAGFVRLRAVWRLGIFMPTVTGLVATGIVFSFLLGTDQGALNWALHAAGLPSIDWLGDPTWAKASLIILLLWHNTGYYAVIYLAGLQGIPKDLYEAATVDGAGAVRRFFSVTLPQLRPILLFTVVLATINSLQLFDEPYVLTHGGPDNATMTVAMYLYQNGFSFFDFGYASAIAYVLTLIVVAFGLVQMRLMGDRK